jgi:hypothetical protein
MAIRFIFVLTRKAHLQMRRSNKNAAKMILQMQIRSTRSELKKLALKACAFCAAPCSQMPEFH